MRMADDGWRESSEGDLDPDLTEEAGYMGWEPPQRGGWRIVQRVVVVLVLVVLIGGALLVLR
ncbi:MAG: hypothetical protein DWI59_00960 [Chloroflexi bacterium]|nr:MAG: hypothetical protein DWI59_00960 [Chloroflexota bacterium]